MIPVRRTDIRILPNPERVLPRYLDFGRTERLQAVLDYVRSLDEKTAAAQLADIYTGFRHRHLDLESLLQENYQRVAALTPAAGLSPPHQLLLGAYFTHEYSIEAAALFNPSIVPHPDQTGLRPGDLRFILSLRAAGEGHISSVTFREGVIRADGDILLDPPAPWLTEGKRASGKAFDKTFVLRRMEAEGPVPAAAGDRLPARFTEAEGLAALRRLEKEKGVDAEAAAEHLRAVFDSNYDLAFPENIPLSSRVLFPSSRAESNGMEDVRFVPFSDQGKTTYLGTYTAYNGRAIRPQLIETEDFRHFRIRPFYGPAASDKGMALFPEKIDGRYAMVGRQGGRELSIMYSDDLHFWDDYQVLQRPERSWERLQMGNCGSPVRTPRGWLLLTHAVGPMRRYVLSFTLLDLERPGRVIASLDRPFLAPNAEEREGYVPNVLYTCGLIEHGEQLYIPYAMSDRATSFAVVPTAAVLEALDTAKTGSL